MQHTCQDIEAILMEVAAKHRTEAARTDEEGALLRKRLRTLIEQRKSARRMGARDEVKNASKLIQKELKAIASRWQTGTPWRIRNITLLKEIITYIHTPCRIAIDLRKTSAQPLLQSTDFPEALVP